MKVSLRNDGLRKWSCVAFSPTGSVHKPLLALGVDRRLIYKNPPFGRRQDFWVRNESRLPEVFQAAHLAYRRAMKKAHTDMGGTHEGAILLNLAWRRVKKLFGQHGVT